MNKYKYKILASLLPLIWILWMGSIGLEKDGNNPVFYKAMGTFCLIVIPIAGVAYKCGRKDNE